MKIRLFFPILLLTISGTTQLASARIVVADIASDDRNPVYTKININNGNSYWLTVDQAKDKNGIHSRLRIEDMSCLSKNTPRSLKVPDIYIAMASTSQSENLLPLIAGMDSRGGWHLHQFRKSLSSIQQSKPINHALVTKVIGSSSNGYFVGGLDEARRPVLQFFEPNLKTMKTIGHQNSGNGEISQVFKANGHMVAIFNAYQQQTNGKEKTPELWFYSTNGKALSRFQLIGLGVYAITLKNGDFAVSYWKNNTLHVERRNVEMETLWTLKLHQRKGISSDVGQLLIAGNEIAWVGANDNRLLVHRISNEGILIQTDSDTGSGLKVPVSQQYAVQAYGDALHIRGTFYPSSANPVSVTAFCAINQPRH